MALRLTDASDLTPAPKPTRTPDVELIERAQELLASGKVGAYRDLFAEAAKIEDEHRRYRARVKLMEHGLGAAARLPDNVVPGLFYAIAKAGMDIAEDEPREPMILNLLGVALYEIGVLGGAESLFRATKRLDPDHPNVVTNLNEVQKRRNRALKLSALLPKHIVAALPALGRRAEEVAKRAKPAEGLTLSLCMIVKDEEEMLPRCLAAAAPAVDEIVVVDTGSTDRTIEIAKEFGAKVIEVEWTGSFAEPRNVSFDAATGDWLMYLDADEVLISDDVDKLRAVTGRTWREAFYLVETNYTGDLEDGTAVTHNALRVFRNRPEYRFEGRIHEQIAQNLPAFIPERLENTQIRVEHYGYLGAVRDAKEKSRRNTELLERQLSEGGDSPFLHFNLGSEYAAAGDSQKALDNFKKAWEGLKDDPQLPSYGFVPSLLDRLTTAYRVTGDRESARRQADEGLRIFPDFTDLVLEKAHAARDDGNLPEAIRLLERCLEMGDAPSRYSSTVGCGTYIALVTLADIRSRSGDLDEAERLLERCLVEHPGYLGVVHPLAAAMLMRGTEPAAVVARIEEHLDEVTPSAHFMLGMALYEAGHAAAAEGRFRAVLDRQPSSEPVRVALAEALLSQKRWQEAAAVAAEVADHAPVAPAACRSQLFALIVGGDAAAVPAALERARGCGVNAGEVALLEAWQAALSGASLPAQLPEDAAGLLLVTLEALLRVQEIDAFAALVPAVELVGLPWRERRELLAQIYFRRGFVDSAADEWIRVCQEAGPDVPALLGLAQVAVVRELPQDAVVFAREVQALEPDHAGAANIVRRLAAAAEAG